MDYKNTGPKVTRSFTGGIGESVMVNIPAPAQSIQQPQVESAMIGLEARASDIRECLRSLEERLKPVLRPLGPEEGQCGDSPNPPGRAPLADAISSINDSLNGSLGILADLNARIEL